MHASTLHFIQYEDVILSKWATEQKKERIQCIELPCDVFINDEMLSGKCWPEV